MKMSFHAQRRILTWSIIFACAFSAEAANGADAVPKAPITLKIVGSSVKNHRGEYLGRIQDIILNPDTGHSEFAMLLVNYPKNTTRVTPVPWALLSYVTDQGQTGGTPGAEQIFGLTIERAKLANAPVLDKSQWSLIARPEWRQQIYAYFGMLVAGAEPAAPVVTEPAPVVQDVPEYAPAPAEPGILVASYASSYTSFGFPYYYACPGPWRCPPSPYYYSSAQPNNTLAGWPSLFPGGKPVIPNGPDMFRAATNYFPGAPAKLPAAPAPISPAANLVPLKPGAPWSPLLPQQVRPPAPGQGRPAFNPRPPPQRVVAQSGRPFAPVLPGPMPPPQPMRARTSMPIAPLAPLAPLAN